MVSSYICHKLVSSTFDGVKNFVFTSLASDSLISWLESAPLGEELLHILYPHMMQSRSIPLDL